MNKYESVIIIEPNLKEKHIEDILKKVTNKIKEFSKECEITRLGKKKLAYEIKHNITGYYALIEFETDDKKAIPEIERFYRITDEIMKFIIVKKY